MKKKIIIFFLCLTIGILYFYFSYGREMNKEAVKTDGFSNSLNSENNSSMNQEHIYVEIQGEVIRPDIYKIKKDSKLFELINSAGGLTKNADLRSINRTITLQDQTKIIIPSLVNSNNSNSTCDKYYDENLICIYIYGNINKAGNYYVKKRTLLKDVIYLASGLKEVDFDYIAKIKNFVLERSTSIEIKFNLDAENSDSKAININTASLELLDSLPKIGVSTAQNIIDYRQKNAFKTIEDIKKVKGIGESTFEAIKEFIFV